MVNTLSDFRVLSATDESIVIFWRDPVCKKARHAHVACRAELALLPETKHAMLIGTTGTRGEPLSSAPSCEDPDDRVRRDD